MNNLRLNKNYNTFLAAFLAEIFGEMGVQPNRKVLYFLLTYQSSLILNEMKVLFLKLEEVRMSV